MIKASELRIGNGVLYKPYGNREGQPVKIEGMYGMRAFFNRHTDECGMFHYLQPIPLTPEILEKCGFKKEVSKSLETVAITENGGITEWVENISYIRNYIKFVPYGIKGFHYPDCPGCFITNLHQLQNIYFALTGEELEIKL